MDCRHPLVPAVAGMLLVAGARVHAGEAGTPGPLQVTGGDFPALVMVVPGDHAGGSRDAMPGCDRIRARRLDELPPGWSSRVGQMSGQKVKPMNTSVQWPFSSPSASWVPSDWRSENGGSGRACGNRVTVWVAGHRVAGVTGPKNFCAASRPRPAASARTRMRPIFLLNMCVEVPR